MGMATTVQDYLRDAKIAFEVVDHPKRLTSVRIADSAHIAENQLAKGVLLRDEEGGFVLAVVGSDRRVDIGEVSHALHKTVELADEQEIFNLFSDCDPGAIPPLGEAYGLPMVIDEALARQDDVYFEAGDHMKLVHMKGDDFGILMRDATPAGFGNPI